jgi:hypothetical protein
MLHVQSVNPKKMQNETYLGLYLETKLTIKSPGRIYNVLLI